MTILKAKLTTVRLWSLLSSAPILKTSRQNSSLVLLAVLLSLASSGWTTLGAANASEKPAEGLTIRPALPTYLESRFFAEVVVWGLEELGYTITGVKELAPALSLQAAADGDVDFVASYIEQGQRPMFEAAGGEEKLQMVGTIMPRYLESYFIDVATAEKHSIQSIEQLQDPNLAKLFDSDSDGKANLLGCPAGWSCQERIDHHLTAYGLEDTVEQVSGDYSVLVADTLARYQQGEPVLYFSYVPYWLSAVLTEEDVKVLEVPFTDLPGDLSDATEADTTYNGKNLGFVADRYRIVVNKEFGADHPIAMRWFEAAQVPTEAVSEASLKISEGADDPEAVRQLAEVWIEANRVQVDQWLEEARATVAKSD